jgi:hypothetical protein
LFSFYLFIKKPLIVDLIKERRYNGASTLLKPNNPVLVEQHKKVYQELKENHKIPPEANGKWIAVTTTIVAMDKRFVDIKKIISFE